jgi:hypothetical protein
MRSRVKKIALFLLSKLALVYTDRYWEILKPLSCRAVVTETHAVGERSETCRVRLTAGRNAQPSAGSVDSQSVKFDTLSSKETESIN